VGRNYVVAGAPVVTSSWLVRILFYDTSSTILYQGSTSGAIDVVAIKDYSGNLSCSPFHVKLSKLGKKGDSCRVVKLAVNSRDVALRMKLGGAGEAFFVERTDRHTLQALSGIATVTPRSFEKEKSLETPLARINSLFVVPTDSTDILGANETR
jgi:nicotinate-nucleotide pyrophosphorylase